MILWFRGLMKQPNFFDLLHLWRYLHLTSNLISSHKNEKICYDFSLDMDHENGEGFEQKRLFLTFHNFNFLEFAEVGSPYSINGEFQVCFRDQSFFDFLYSNMCWSSEILKEYEFSTPLAIFIKGGIKIGRI